MSLTADDITIVVTVYNRRLYLKQAIASALAQTIPVRVFIADNCSTDLGLEEFVRQEFGLRIEYVRGTRHLGIFGNFNAAMRHCRTPWLSILHDDDYLAPNFVETILELSRQAPDCGLYFGETEFVSETGKPLEPISSVMRPPWEGGWRRVKLSDTLVLTPFPFPGQLFRVDYAQAVGGFRETSLFAGDWELWSNLIARYGAAQTKTLVAYNRCHTGPNRGCSRIALSGEMRPLVFVQQKRVLALLRWQGSKESFRRAEILKRSPMSINDLLRFGAGFSPRLLRYHVGLLLRSSPPSAQYAVFQLLTRIFGVPFVRAASRLKNGIRGEVSANGGRARLARPATP